MNFNRSPYATEYPQAFTESSLHINPQSLLPNSSSHGLQLDVHPQPGIRYLSPSDALDRHHLKSDSGVDFNDSGVEFDDTTNVQNVEDNGDEWESEDGFDLVKKEDADYRGLDPYHGLQRPPNIHRDSTDVEFSHRMHNGKRGAKHAWEVNVRMPPRMRGGVARGKTLLKHLRGSLKRPHPTNSTTRLPSFEFRDTQPVPISVRQQYLELVKENSDGGDEVVAEKLLTPPTRSRANSPSPSVKRRQTTGSLLNPPTSESNTTHKLSRSRSASQSQTMSTNIQPGTTLHLPSLDRRTRSRSPTVSRHSSNRSGHSIPTIDDERTAASPHGSQTHESGETTVVNHTQYTQDPALIPLPASSYNTSTKSSFKMLNESDRSSSSSHTTAQQTIPSVAYRRPANPQPSRKPIWAPHLAPVLQVLAKLQRLPWFAEPEAPPGAFLPTGPAPRVAADYIPARSGRGKYGMKRDNAQKALTWKRKGGTDKAEEEEEEEGNGSWYKPSSRELQRSVRTMYPDGINPGVSAVGNVYQNYFAALGRTGTRGGRPLGYMYSSPSDVSGTSLYPYSYPIRPPPSVATKSVDQVSTGVPTQPLYAQGYIYPQTQQTAELQAQPQQVLYQAQYVYPNFSYTQIPQSFVNRVPGSSPPLPPLPPPTVPSYATYISTSTSSSSVDSKSLPPLPPGSLGYATSIGSGYGTILPPNQLQYADYVYSYV